MGFSLPRLVRRFGLYAMIGRSAGAFVLGAAGLLDGRPFTTHVEDADELERRTDGGTAQIAVRWVDDGDVMAAGGMTSGIAATLHLIERVAGRALADATARQMGLRVDITSGVVAR